MKTEKELEGKQIKSATLKGHKEDCDSINVLILEMTDGSIFEIEGGYGRYTGASCEEYIETVKVSRKK